MSKAIAGHRYRHYKKETMLYTVVSADALDCESVKPLRFLLYAAPQL